MRQQYSEANTRHLRRQNFFTSYKAWKWNFLRKQKVQPSRWLKLDKYAPAKRQFSYSNEVTYPHDGTDKNRILLRWRPRHAGQIFCEHIETLLNARLIYDVIARQFFCKRQYFVACHVITSKQAYVISTITQSNLNTASRLVWEYWRPSVRCNAALFVCNLAASRLQLGHSWPEI